ncbi:hypothetical protein ACP70R_002304 [Stipagrostis hirtigluma subsp. patula]
MDQQQYYYYYFCMCYMMWRRRALSVLVLLLALWWRCSDGRRSRDRGAKYGPLVDRDISRTNTLTRLIDASESTCIKQLRMTRAVFYKLCTRLKQKGLLVDTFHVSIEEQVAMFLRMVGQHHTNASVGFWFWRSGETVSRYFNAVLDAMVQLAKDLIYVRSTNTHPKITSSPNRFYPYFEGCIGALDGTHVRACVPAHMVDRFRGRKSYPSQNVLAVVDFDLRFTYVLAGWEGSAHDSLVLQDALSRPAGLKIPEGKFYLADAGYAARPGILPPYRGVRYHLNEFSGSRDPTTPQELFNHRHSTLRTTVERAFGTLKNRFKILGQKPEEDYSSREKYITWSDEATKFMLEWYIELRKDKPATFKFKKQHHLQCADAVNAKFALGATQNQVDRHYRSYKEKWGWVRRAMGNSGNGFDATSCKFTLSESEKAKLSKTTVNYLTRPIRFFHLLEELFSDQSQADGSLAADQTTVNVGDDSDDDGVKEIEGYTLAGNSDEDADSDTIARLSPKTDLDGKPSSKRRKREKSPSKKPTKGKVSNNDMAASIVMLANSLANPPPVPPSVPVQPVVPADPYANLWNRINALTITAKDRLAIVAYLSSPSQEVFRSYLNSSPDSMLNEWVISFFDHQQGGTQGSGGAF